MEHLPDIFAGVRYALNEGGITEMLQERVTYYGIEIGTKQVVTVLLRAPSREQLQQARIALEPWFIGGIFMFFLLGATSTKDFSDMEGDRLGGCRTLPIVFGVRKAAYMIAPFFVLPWLLMPLGAVSGILTANPTALIPPGIIGSTCS